MGIWDAHQPITAIGSTCLYETGDTEVCLHHAVQAHSIQTTIESTSYVSNFAMLIELRIWHRPVIGMLPRRDPCDSLSP